LLGYLHRVISLTGIANGHPLVMRNYIMYFFSLFLIEVTGQETSDAVKPTDTTSLSVTDEIVLFPDSASVPVGGLDQFYNYLLMNLRYPKEARASKTTGKVIVEFVVEKDGSISSQNIKVLKTPHKSLSKEAIRLIKNGPTWIPGKLKGVPVRTRQVLPISFNLS
jgi:TonB family protein